jgi:hypothetical protein
VYIYVRICIHRQWRWEVSMRRKRREVREKKDPWKLKVFLALPLLATVGFWRQIILSSWHTCPKLNPGIRAVPAQPPRSPRSAPAQPPLSPRANGETRARTRAEGHRVYHGAPSGGDQSGRPPTHFP